MNYIKPYINILNFDIDDVIVVSGQCTEAFSCKGADSEELTKNEFCAELNNLYGDQNIN